MPDAPVKPLDRVRRLFLFEPGEGRVVMLAAVFHFLVLGVNSTLTPLRDTMGVEADVDLLPRLTWGTLGAMLVMNPLFTWLLHRIGRRSLAKLAFRFGAACLVAAGLVFLELAPKEHPWLARAFYVWVSVFNLFFVSLFWSVMADTFSETQGRRLFAMIGAAGTIGGIAGASTSKAFTAGVGYQWSAIAAAVALELCAWCVIAIVPAAPRAAPQPAGGAAGGAPVKGGALAGLRAVAASPYLVLVCLFLFLYTFTSQFLQLEKSNIVARAITSTNERVAFFADVKWWINVVTLVVQTLLTGRFLSKVGVRGGLLLVPLVTCAGFAVLGHSPLLAVVAVFEVARSGMNYAVARPSREVVWTVVPREQKYAAKNFIETFVYRGGDALAAGGFDALKRAADLSLSGIAYVAILPAIAWVAVALLVGAGHRRRAAAIDASTSIDARNG